MKRTCRILAFLVLGFVAIELVMAVLFIFFDFFVLGAHRSPDEVIDLILLAAVSIAIFGVICAGILILLGWSRSR
jgi:hypothetical protein